MRLVFRLGNTRDYCLREGNIRDYCFRMGNSEVYCFRVSLQILLATKHIFFTLSSFMAFHCTTVTCASQPRLPQHTILNTPYNMQY